MKKIINKTIKADNKNALSIVTGPLAIHNVVESYTKGQNFRYLTIPEMSILYPYLTPLTHEAK